jgi:hypothetical protein
MNSEEKCPKCESENVEKRHHNPTFALPECDYFQCEECEHQWGHS